MLLIQFRIKSLLFSPYCRQAQNQPVYQIMFYLNSSPLDLCIMTLYVSVFKCMYVHIFLWIHISDNFAIIGIIWLWAYLSDTSHLYETIKCIARNWTNNQSHCSNAAEGAFWRAKRGEKQAKRSRFINFCLLKNLYTYQDISFKVTYGGGQLPKNMCKILKSLADHFLTFSCIFFCPIYSFLVMSNKNLSFLLSNNT